MEELDLQSKLVILDKEIGPCLARYVMNRNRLMSVVLCESLEKFIDVFGDGSSAVGLIGQDYLAESRGRLDGLDSLFVLCERITRNNARELFKYQPADVLLRKLYTCLIETGRYMPGGSAAIYEKKIVGFCSSMGVAAQTEIAFMYALFMGKQKHRTLFLTFNYYSGFFDEEGLDLGDLFYEMKKGAGANLAIEAVAKSCMDIDYVKPVSRQMDIENIDGEDLSLLVGRLLAESDYEIIVIDMAVRPALLRVAYKSCERLFCLREEGEVFEKSQALLSKDLEDFMVRDDVLVEVVLPDRMTPQVLREDDESLLDSNIARFVKSELIGKYDDRV